MKKWRPLNTLIIDDEPIALEKLRSYVAKTPTLNLCAASDNAPDAIEIVNSMEIDLIITDINMPDLDGLSFIESLVDAPMVIFTTAYADYAVRSYRVNTVDYLLKPYNFADFQRAVNKAVERASLKNGNPAENPADAATANQDIEVHSQSGGDTNNPFFIKVDYRFIRIDPSDIRYIKGYGEYLQIYLCSSPTPLVTLGSFSGIMRHLGANFLQVHRSYAVNMHQVSRIEKMRLIMDETTVIPVSDGYRKEFMDYLEHNSFGLKR